MVTKLDDDVTKELLAKKTGWIGVDVDGTVFEYRGWVAWNVFGNPIPAMVDRIRAWHDAGVEVRFVTARVGLPISDGVLYRVDDYKKHVCRTSGVRFSDADMVAALHEHCRKHDVPELRVQCWKDARMIELWDDRAVQVVPNEGVSLADAHAAELSALRGKAFEQ